MISKSTLLLHYKRKDIQEAMVAHAKDREVAIKFGDSGFGQRPQILAYPNDILESAMQGATSFHCSEERWKNPIQLSPSLQRREMEDLRLAWDLVLDVDCPVWDVAKLVTNELIEALKQEGVQQISVKFSGNKGFHIGVPAEAFPQTIGNTSIASLFPDAPRKIAAYLVAKCAPKVEAELAKTASLKEWVERVGLSWGDIAQQKCLSCSAVTPFAKAEELIEWICGVCQHNERTSLDKIAVKCPKKHGPMSRAGTIKKEGCPKCGKKSMRYLIDLTKLLSVDTVLISPRHLYRMPYSLHEKSGLCSVPINPNSVLDFEREFADPKLVDTKYSFLNRENASPSARQLLINGLDHNIELADPRLEKEKNEKSFENFTEAAPEWSFPPCIQHIAKGLPDGKKRAMFILINFLSTLNWTPDDIAKYLRTWNEKNPEPLREVLIEGHVRYHKQTHKDVLPPNCDNKMYYKDLGICHPDSLCRKIKNPVNYAIIRTKMKAQDEKANTRDLKSPPRK